MKHLSLKNKGLFLGLILFSLSSCVKDNDISITEPIRYTSSDVNSYADLFKVFWTVMDQQYAYFAEQYEKDGMDWTAVYNEYYPKFEALKTWAKTPGISEDIINSNTELAKQYFEDIINRIIDRHFFVKILMPYNGTTRQYLFYGNMKGETAAINFFTRSYMGDRLTGSMMKTDILLTGNLISNPDIYYLRLDKFNLFVSFALDLNDQYLIPSTGDKYLLTVADVDGSAHLNAIKDAGLRKRVGDLTKEILNQWNAFLNMSEVKTFNNEVKKFKTTENISSIFLSTVGLLLDSMYELKPYSDIKTYAAVYNDETSAYLDWFMTRMDQHLQLGYEFLYFKKAALEIIRKGQFYKTILNPLHRGEIKKMIIDLRANGGGNAVDLAFFINRLVTKENIFGYQRLKEGNGRFNYTPWVPLYTAIHPFGIPSKIPIVILTDRGSASTSEIATAMLKSQGEHVISIGDYSTGATAALAESDKYNGGSTDKIAGGFLEFYMPVMAFKDQHEKVIEGVGIKPDIFVEPLSDSEISAAQLGQKDFVDRTLNEAIKHLSRQ